MFSLTSLSSSFSDHLTVSNLHALEAEIPDGKKTQFRNLLYFVFILKSDNPLAQGLRSTKNAGVIRAHLPSEMVGVRAAGRVLTIIAVMWVLTLCPCDLLCGTACVQLCYVEVPPHRLIPLKEVPV